MHVPAWHPRRDPGRGAVRAAQRRGPAHMAPTRIKITSASLAPDDVDQREPSPHRHGRRARRPAMRIDMRSRIPSRAYLATDPSALQGNPGMGSARAECG